MTLNDLRIWRAILGNILDQLNNVIDHSESQEARDHRRQFDGWLHYECLPLDVRAKMATALREAGETDKADDLSPPTDAERAARPRPEHPRRTAYKARKQAKKDRKALLQHLALLASPGDRAALPPALQALLTKLVGAPVAAAAPPADPQPRS